MGERSGTEGTVVRSGAELRGTGRPGSVRAEDLEPYVGLQYVARLFKISALVVFFALAGETIAGLLLEGTGSMLALFREVIQGTVLAAFLWGAADLVLLLIDVGHDVRGFRILLARISYRAARAAEPDAAVPVRPRDRTP